MPLSSSFASLLSATQRLRLRDLMRRGVHCFFSRLLQWGIIVLGGRLSASFYRPLHEQALVDPADVRRVTQHICRHWHEGLDCNHRGIQLGSLVEYKVAGYDVALWHRVRIVQEVLSLWETAWKELPFKAVISFSITPTFPEFVLQRVAAQGGTRLIHLVPKRVVNRRFRKCQTQRYREKDYNPFEVPLLNVQPVAEDPLVHVDMQSILFFASMDGYLTPMISVMEKLGTEQPACVLLPRVAKSRWRCFRDIPQRAQILFIEDLFDCQTAQVFHDALEKYAQLWDASKDRLRSRFAVDGVNFWEACEGDMQHIVTGYLPHCAAYVEMARRLSERIQPKVIIGARLRRAVEQAFFAVARQQGVPSLLLMHGEIMGRPYDTFFNMAKFEHVDKVCLWGKHHKQSVLSEFPDIVSDSIVITGNPAYDVLKDIRSVPKDAMRTKVAEQLGLSASPVPWITFTTGLNDTVFLFRAVQQAVAATPDALLLVKLHPGQSPQFYRNHLLAGLNDNVLIVKHEDSVDLFELFRASDVVLTKFSTTALDALAADIPLIIADVDPELRRRRPERFDFQRYGIPVAKDQTALTETLQRLVQDPQARHQAFAAVSRAREDLVGGVDGKAAERVIQVIRELERPVGLVPKARSDRIDR